MTDRVPSFLYIIHAPRHLNTTLPLLFTPDCYIKSSATFTCAPDLIVLGPITCRLWGKGQESRSLSHSVRPIAYMYIFDTYDDLYHGCNSP